jgi:hypothetical protein
MDVDITVGDSFHDAGSWIVVSVIAIDHVAPHVIDDAALGESFGRRRIRPVQPDELDSDPQPVQLWIVKRRDDGPVGSRDEGEPRAIIGSRSAEHVDSVRRSGYEVA